ncbi:MAG: amidohydrolase [Betaproteobacteria bacterium]|nr:amidohydrolase [Betaproteobacteria bacterium]
MPRVSSDFIPVRPEWLALHREEVLEPGLPIIDPHHHLWAHPGNPYLLANLLEDIDCGHNIVSTVFVECRAMYRAGGAAEMKSLGETEFVNGIAAMSASGGYGSTRICEGIVGNVDLRLAGRAGAMLEAHMAVAGGRFRGIRNVSAWHAGIKATSSNPPQGLLLDGNFRAGFANLSRLGLSFDAWLVHTQLDELLDLARTFSETTIVLDHVGGPLGIGPYVGKREEVFARWSALAADLARCPNVHVKLGGLGMHVPGFDFHTRERAPASPELAQAWKPYIETCIGAFGAERCMFESNFPVDKGTCSYPILWNAFKHLTKNYSADEKAALYSGTAAKVYRLTRPV